MGHIVLEQGIAVDYDKIASLLLYLSLQLLQKLRDSLDTLVIIKNLFLDMQ